MDYYAQQPFYNPTIPFNGAIHGRLVEGKTIIISGRVLPGANRFHVNLQCGSGSGVDMALHFNPRYDEGTPVVVANTYQRGRWGAEERKHSCPFPQGSSFSLMFNVGRDSYKVATNGQHFMEYKHRISFTAVDTIRVEGPVEISSIAFQNPQPQFPSPPHGFPFSTPTAPPMPAFPTMPGFPSPCPPPMPSFPSSCQPPMPTIPSPYPPPVSYTVPYKSIINGGLYPGRTITIQGVISQTAKRIAVNLRYGSGIALHYNPRFDENQVVRNSHMLEKWGSEERQGGMPFRRGQQFTLTIVCSQTGYNIMVNGNQVHTYKHRHKNPKEVDILEISGELSLSSVTF